MKNNHKEIADLRRSGLKVYVNHSRRLDKRGNILPKGGTTFIEVVDPKTNLKFEGKAVCSQKDTYNKKLGVKIALGRALKWKVSS